MSQIKTALISVYYKTGIEELARCLVNGGTEILSTGGTLTFLREKGIAVTSISDYTGQAEILGGRVKTLHPKIFAGILARRSNPDDMATLKEAGIKPIDLVVVNLYPFEETIAKADVTLEEAIEQIDIGGVALIRAAAKNHADVCVCACPEDYKVVQEALEKSPSQDELTVLRRRLAAQAFAATSDYDNAIGAFLASAGAGAGAGEAEPYPAVCEVRYGKVQDLRYGENPHQTAAFYRKPGTTETCVATARQLHGKELSYNNIIDLDSALEVVRAFEETVCCIIKHNNPCGVARAASLPAAYRAARACDPVSAFGGVIGFNREVDAETATAVAEVFVEAVIAPGFSADALAILGKKKNIRLLETGPFNTPLAQPMLKSVVGGLLVQTRDLGMVDPADLRVVSAKQPKSEDIEALLFAWRVAKFVKSNAIVYTGRDATIGIGAGQMSRIDSTNLAAVKAQSPVRGAYMASDAFFPFRDNVDRAADIGIKAIISPGGSVRDDEVIAAGDEHGMIMVFTGMRHFRH